MARIRFLSEQVYETGGPNMGPRFAKGFVLDGAAVGEILGTDPTPEYVAAFLERWVQRGVAEYVDGRTPATEPETTMDGAGGGDDPEADALSAELDGMTVTDLKAFAEERGIDLGDASKKVDIRAAIDAALAA